MELATLPKPVIESSKRRGDLDTGLIRLDPVPVEAGSKVRVFDGPLAGTEGIFKERKGENLVLLLMKLLGTESTVEVDALLLQKAM